MLLIGGPGGGLPTPWQRRAAGRVARLVSCTAKRSSSAPAPQEHYGYSVLVAEDGEHGLELFCQAADHIQRVVLDMTMPAMSGEETLSRLRTLVPIFESSLCSA